MAGGKPVQFGSAHPVYPYLMGQGKLNDFPSPRTGFGGKERTAGSACADQFFNGMKAR
jgi:hypothetical protein